jgi:hypothetical protein
MFVVVRPSSNGVSGEEAEVVVLLRRVITVVVCRQKIALTMHNGATH